MIELSPHSIDGALTCLQLTQFGPGSNGSAKKIVRVLEHLKRLSEIVPCYREQNGFQTWDFDACSYLRPCSSFAALVVSGRGLRALSMLQRGPVPSLWLSHEKLNSLRLDVLKRFLVRLQHEIVAKCLSPVDDRRKPWIVASFFRSADQMMSITCLVGNFGLGHAFLDADLTQSGKNRIDLSCLAA